MRPGQLPLLRAFANPRLRLAVAAIVLAAATVRFGLSLVEAFANMTDFRVFFVPAARLAWAGGNPYHVIPLSPPGQFLGPTSGSDDTPTFLMLMWPWTWLPDDLGRVAWIVVELGCLGGVLVIVSRALGGLPRTQWMTAAALMMVFPPVRDSFNEGQVGLVLGLLLVGALYAAESGRARLSGACLGLAIAIKLTPVLFCAYFAWRRRWSALVYAALATATLFGSTLLLGWGRHWAPFMAAIGQVGHGTANVLNQSIGGLILRAYDAHLNSQPIAAPPAGVRIVILTAAAALALALAGVVLRSRLPADEQPWADLAILLLVIPLVQPFAWPHHFAQAAVFCVVAVVMVARRRLPAVAGVWLAAIYLFTLVAYHGLFVHVRAAGADRIAHDPILQLEASALLLAVIAAALTWAWLPRSLTRQSKI